MKQLILGVALVACCLVSCKSSQNTAVSDPNSASMPAAECGPCPGKSAECTGEKASSCTEKTSACCDKKPQG